jgi:hypothetical protein
MAEPAAVGELDRLAIMMPVGIRHRDLRAVRPNSHDATQPVVTEWLQVAACPDPCLVSQLENSSESRWVWMVPREFMLCLLHLVILTNSIQAMSKLSTEEYAIQKFLNERSLWLRSMYNVSDIDLDSEIQKFALPESDSTVRYFHLQNMF